MIIILQKEVVNKPGSVFDDHLSGIPVTRYLKRFTWEWRAALTPNLTLHRPGFTWPIPLDIAGGLLH